MEKAYVAIDLKSFFASVACVDRGLDPLGVHLVVADASRTEKTICLAVSPALKAYGIPGRARLFEVVQRVAQVNRERLRHAPGHRFTGASSNAEELKRHPEWALDYIVAPPQMARYMAVSARIYQIYLQYVAPEDIHVYSIDEVMMDVTRYLSTYGLTARELTVRMIRHVLRETGITATAGIGTNLFLCKVAMDVEAKRCAPDRDGVRMAELNERTFREKLWSHRPLTDFWRVGAGYAKKLEAHRMYTLGDVARRSLTDEEQLYRLFGVNAELLIDHAWGVETCTLADIKRYRPESSSVGAGQVLQCPYPFDRARVILREMTDALALSLLDKKVTTAHLEVTVGYDRENLEDPALRRAYQGAVVTDGYGRALPKQAHGVVRLPYATASARQMVAAVLKWFDEGVNQDMTVRRIYVTACELQLEEETRPEETPRQTDLFTSVEEQEAAGRAEIAALEKEKKAQEALLKIKRRFGKNAVMKGTSYREGATGLQRNGQIGGHKA